MNKNQGHFQAFNKKFFEKHQRKLLWLLNNSIIKYWFRWVLRIHKDLKWDEKICEIQPNNYKVYLGMYLIKGRLQHKIRADFRTHNKFSKRLYFAFKLIWWTMHFLDWILFDRWKLRFNFGFSILTVYPNANPETTSVDGYVIRQDVAETLSNIRSGAGNNHEDFGQFLVCYLSAFSTSNQYRELWRTIVLFDTSTLPDNATISNGVLSLYGSSKSNGLGSPSIGLVSSNPASNTGLVNADYAQSVFGSTEFASRITYASFSTTAYNDFTLNSSGLSNISKTSISKFGVLLSWDIDNSAPWVSNQVSDIQSFSADNTGTSSDPKLVITYTISQNYTQTISNTLSLSNSLTKGIIKIASNTINLSNNILNNISKILNNTISLSDTVQSIKLILISITNTLNFSNIIQKNIGKVIENTANLTNSIIKDAYKSISNTINLSNIISAAKIVYKTITNTVNLSNSIIKSISKSIENTATFSNTINAIRTFTKIIVNTITLSSTISKGIAKIIINTIILTTKNLFNGLTTWYSDKYQKQNTDYSDKY